jgi:uncharacterized protein YegL
MAQRNQYDNEAFTSAYFSQYNSTITNGEARIPICFCIDTSASMNFVTNPDSELIRTSDASHSIDGVKNVVYVNAKPGYTLRHRIDEVRRVLDQMLDRMRLDSRIANAVTVCIVTFDRWSDCVVEFSDVTAISRRAIAGISVGEDVTNASKGIEMALARIDQFRRMNSQAGNESYRPVLVFMSDGSVSGDPNANFARREVRERSESNRLNVIPIGIGRSADEGWMRQMSKDGQVFHMERQAEFDQVFSLITKRIERTAKALTLDEELVENTPNYQEPVREDEVNTTYGADRDDDALEEFMDFFNIDTPFAN